MKARKYIARHIYMEKIRPFIGKNIIKVFVGQRRVGKSYIMRQVADEILSGNPTANIIYIDKELLEFSSIKDYQNLYDYVVEHAKDETANYLFVDEVQEIDGFELALRSLLNEEVCDIYCSGSNAKMLSGELASHLSGRYIAINVYSLCYREYIDFNKLEPNRDSLREYLDRGGMPYLTNLPTDREISFEYLKNIYSTILLKDVISRQHIKNIAFIESLVNFIADNIGATFSAKSICDFLKSQSISITVPTIQNHINMLCDSYMIYRTQRIDVHGLKVFEIGEKYYFEDFGIRNALRNATMATDINKLMENAVYKELLVRGYKVYVGKLWQKEVDFVAENSVGKIYVQVCYMLSSDETIEREFGNLRSIKNDYPKYVVSMDEFNCANKYPGIRQVHLNEFLLMDRYN